MHPDAHTCTRLGGASVLHTVHPDAADTVYASWRPFVRRCWLHGMLTYFAERFNFIAAPSTVPFTIATYFSAICRWGVGMLIVPLAVTDKRTICPRPKVTTWSAVASLTFFTCIVGSQVNPSSGKIAVVKFTENNISMNINISMLRGVTNYSQYKFANTRGQELDDRVWIDNYYQN